MTTSPTPIDPTVDAEPRRALEAVLYETKRVIVGQDAMLERLLVALLANGHVLLEGVPGLAKTLTVKTLARVLGGTYKRVQFTPDLVPADLVGTRIWRPDTGEFDTQLGPVFGNLLLADEINRAPGEGPVRAARGHAGAPGHARRAHLPAAAARSSSLATQNPIESEGTYPLPEAQVDRFLFKLLVDYPSMGEEAAIVGRVIGEPEPTSARSSTSHELERFREHVQAIFVDRNVLAYAVRLADATRYPEKYGLDDVARQIEYGASPRGPIGLVQAAQALALLRGRTPRHDPRRARPRPRRPAPPHGPLLRGAGRRHRARRDPRARDVAS